MSHPATSTTQRLIRLREVVFAHLRSCGCDYFDAEDLTQDVFCRLTESNKIHWIETAGPGEELKIKNYVLVTARNLMRDRYRRRTAAKRGGEAFHVSVDDEDTAPQVQPATETTPAMEAEWYEARREWRRHVASLEQEAAASGKQALFATLRDSLEPGYGHADYAATANSLGLKTRNVRVQARAWRLTLIARVRGALEFGCAA